MSKTDQSFDPSAHVCAKQRWFEDFAVGERYILPSRTVTSAHFAAFQMLSGDNHPIHYDEPFCRARGFGGLLAHGLQTLCFTAAGAGAFPHEVSDSLVAFLELSARFLNGVVEGDTLYPALEIVELRPGRATGVIVMRATVHNDKRELVLDGAHTYLVKKRA
ncbi:MAG: MaoC family dehydratase [Hyphomicrobiales bacterium]|nr:MaoC family dehydratase [Hyphomicrobiales bacterium]